LKSILNDDSTLMLITGMRFLSPYARERNFGAAPKSFNLAQQKLLEIPDILYYKKKDYVILTIK